MDSKRVDDETLARYSGRLTQAKLLTSEEEVELTRAAKLGDATARQRLIESNMRLVINIAKGYRNRSIPLEDLIQEGAIGLIQAAERFDPDKGFRFSTYATHWIRQAISRAIDNKSKAIRQPAHVAQLLRRVERERQLLASQMGREPSLEVVAEHVGVPLLKLRSILLTAHELVSLDVTLGDRDGLTLGSLIKDESLEADPHGTLMNQELIEELRNCMQFLSERERKVMNLRFRFDGGEPSPPDEVGQALQISKERVRQIELQAIKKLRQIAQKKRGSKDIFSR